MQTIFVTGGAGFIGSHVVERLLSRGDRVVVYDSLTTGTAGNIPPEALFIKGDIRDKELVEQSVARHQPDGIIHLAAQSKVGPSLEKPEEDLSINILGTVHMLEAARKTGVSRFVSASSAAVYGDVDRLPIMEVSPKEPLSPYGTSKLGAEQYIQSYARLYSIRTAALRFANVYGPRQTVDTEAGVITIFCEALLAGRQVYIQGDGGQTRDFVYVKDVAEAVIEALNKETVRGVYNVSSETQTSINELLQQLSRAAGKDPEPDHGDPRPGDIRHSFLSYQRLHEAAGWSPKVSLAEGLKRTMEYYQQK
ncbi:SDR family NAD(P)-dependent oxidoreductase [Alkalicoccus halolimnae]|uniref:SDR family NAD(P)-dependent oxidoreductase n=1 Tax=Alkalicoccus halolimnae TaxID=1667239 RepID=A0A5C7F4H0_9BACI|nr:SDR family NAD(P)-dependent oxidoreductase [Alkalicoccus halolimnae]TXF85532.1 SDR family NAD(P)-dependent oxidoreductase [Alkalicoccus halolimnae]